jgi:hypothetical protein
LTAHTGSLQALHTLMAATRQTMIEPGIRVSGDALLQASRRVDWRFLLPDPRLLHVAYVAVARGTLLESLELFSMSVTVINPASLTHSTMKGADCDLVVMQSPTAALLQHAIPLLRVGGWLYVEGRGATWRAGLPRRHGRPRTASDYAQVLGGLHLKGVAAFWHWPDFDSCTRIIPLGDTVALPCVLGRLQHGARHRLQSVVARWMLKGGLIGSLVPCFSLVAQRR